MMSQIFFLERLSRKILDINLDYFGNIPQDLLHAKMLHDETCVLMDG